MKWFQMVMVAMTLSGAIGCSSEPPPPPEMTEDLRSQIEQEDAAVEAEESQQP